MKIENNKLIYIYKYYTDVFLKTKKITTKLIKWTKFTIKKENIERKLHNINLKTIIVCQRHSNNTTID